MKQDNSEFKKIQQERDFVDFMQRGDDFFKIQLLRQAKVWYNKALILNIGNEEAKSHISECEKLLAFENKVVFYLILVVSVLVLMYLIIL
jgi:hypothetical protein